MAGGKASRMGYVAKPLMHVCGKPLIEHVIEAARQVTSRIVIALSQSSPPELVGYCGYVECIMTPGTGYPEDLGIILSMIRQRPLLVLPADLAWIDGDTLRKFITRAAGVEAGVATMVCRGEPQGISLIKGDSMDWVDIEVDCNFINVNTWKDLEEAKKRCGSTAETRHQG